MSSFGGSFGKSTRDYVKAVKDAITTMIKALPEITIKDEDEELDSKELDSKYELIYSEVVEYTTPIIKALNELPVYYRYHIKNDLVLGKGPKITHYKGYLTKKRNQSQKRKEKKRNGGRVNKKRSVEDVEKVEDVEIVEDVEKVEDFEKFVNQFNKRLRVDDV